jgi:hypothetical protein
MPVSNKCAQELQRNKELSIGSEVTWSLMTTIPVATKEHQEETNQELYITPNNSNNQGAHHFYG